jgi:Bacterial regulatory protein, arsR family
VATVAEATADIGASKPTISRHLRILEEAGVVSRVIDGHTHRLALHPETLAQAEEWIGSQQRVLEAPLGAVAEHRDYSHATSSPSGSATCSRLTRWQSSAGPSVGAHGQPSGGCMQPQQLACSLVHQAG